MNNAADLWKCFVQLQMGRGVRRRTVASFYFVSVQIHDNHIVRCQQVVIHAAWFDDEQTAFPVNPVAAALILADKMDVRANRVREKARAAFDIHDRVNYSVKKHEVTLTEKEIYLTLAIDTEVCAVIEYFEIFMDRMLLCRRAAEKLGLHFALVINGQRMA